MKNQADSLHRFIFENTPIRGERVHLDAAWKNVLARHNYPPVLQQMLGELAAAAVLLAATLKLDGALVLQIQGTGSIKLLVVECDGEMHMRATAKWEGELNGTLPDLVGEGHFVITLAPKNGKQAYQGIVALEGATISDILQNYMTRSEQLETRLWLAADGQVAAGMLLQKMPEQDNDQDDDTWSRVTQLAATLRGDELMQLPTQELLHRLFNEDDVRLFEHEPVSFLCSCTRDKVSQMLRMLGEDEVDTILTERSAIEVYCEFCNECYTFDKVDAVQLFASAAPVITSATRH